MLHSLVSIGWMPCYCLFCHVCTLFDHLNNLETFGMQFGAKLKLTIFSNIAFKIIFQKWGFDLI
jgi:uncharacterized membrane protein